MRVSSPILAMLIALAVASACAGGEDGTPNPALPSSSPDVSTASPASPAADEIARLEHEIAQQINDRREENGLAALEYREDAADVAREYSQLMLEEDFFSHTGPDGKTVADRVREAGIRYTAVGENLFKSVNATDPVEAAVEGWMESEGHRENILRETFTQTGIGVARSGATYYVTQVFLRP